MRHKHSIFKHLTIIHSHGDKNQPASAQYIVAWVCAGNKMKRLYFCSSLAEKREDKLLFNLLLSSLSCAMWLHQLKLVLWSTLQILCSRWALPVSVEVLQTYVVSAVVLVLFLSFDEWCVSFFGSCTTLSAEILMLWSCANSSIMKCACQKDFLLFLLHFFYVPYVVLV